MRTRIGGQAALLVILWIAGCAGVSTNIESPRVSIADVRLVNANLFSQTYRLRLNIQNPNPTDLPIDGMTYELRFNGQPFASGVSGQAVTVPRYGIEVVEVDAIGTLSNVLRQLTQLERASLQGFRYSVKGQMELRNLERRVGFDESGEISFVPERLIQ